MALITPVPRPSLPAPMPVNTMTDASLLLERETTPMLRRLHDVCSLDDTALVLNVGFDLEPGRLEVSFRRRPLGHWTSCGQRLAWHSTTGTFCLARSVEQALAYTVHVIMEDLSAERGGKRERRKPRML